MGSEMCIRDSFRTYDEQSYAEQEALIQAKEYVRQAQRVALVSQYSEILGFNFMTLKIKSQSPEP